MRTEINPAIFRAYDIRGIVDKDLTEESVKLIGQAIGSEIIDRGKRLVIIGRDGRLSGERLLNALSIGIQKSGCDVINVGAVPTPVLYFATYILGCDSGVMLTGSHNPADYNGIKMMIGHEALSGEAIQKLYHRVQNNDLRQGEGVSENADIIDRYIDRIVSDVHLDRPLKIVVDCGSGIGGLIVPTLYRRLGCEVIELFCNVDGNFPYHHPDPSQLENLQDLIHAVKEYDADIGLAFDGDADRLGVITNAGTNIWPDRQLMLFAIDVLSRTPGSEIIYDVKCTRFLKDLILEQGGKPFMWKTGHSFIKAKMQASGAALGGEMSGHMFFKERWYGFDDGIYAGARLLEILSKQSKDAEALFNALPNSVNTPELKIPVEESEKFALVELLQEKATFDDAEIITIDGIRVEFADGWGLIRASNTTPYLVARFEARDEAVLEKIQKLFKAELQRLAPHLQLPF